MQFDPHHPLSAELRDAVGEQISVFLAEQRPTLAAIGAELDPLARLAAELTAGGKRLRPAFCLWGFVAAAGIPDHADALLRAAASLDLLHVSALVHDDVMDASDTRRGVPAAHRQLEHLHRERQWRGDPASFGQGGAILLGDLLLMWSAEMLQRSGLDDVALARALPLVQAMRTEVTAGQFLDVVSQATRIGAGDPAQAADEANRVVEYKSARYTVQRPVQFGAALGGADPALLGELARYGSPLGRAFQFRDDLLGVFGDTAQTGKPAGDDLREGKRTLLVAYGFEGASEPEATRLAGLLGDPELTDQGVADARQILEQTGARQRVEEIIEAGLTEALAALTRADLTDAGRVALTGLAEAAVRRVA